MHHEGEDIREPVLILLSPQFLENPQPVIERMLRSGWEDLVYYVIQQIQQFAMRDDFLLRYKDTDVMNTLSEKARTSFLASLPPEKSWRDYHLSK